MNQIVKFMPAFDKRDPDPRKDYGIGAVECWMTLVGDKGAVTFSFSTGMHLPETQKEWLNPLYHKNYPQFKDHLSYMGYQVGYHSPHSMYEDQKISKENCDFIGTPCYWDCSYTAADKFIDALVREGSDKVWEMLEEYYKDHFEKESLKE